MELAALLVQGVLDEVEQLVVPGVRTCELADVAMRLLEEAGAGPGSVVHTSVEDTVWHGRPSSRILSAGEILTVDIACTLDGWWSDGARSFAVGQVDRMRANLLSAAREGTRAVVESLRPGQTGREAAGILSQLCAGRGVRLVPEAAGHGIGLGLHQGAPLTYDGRSHEALVAGRAYTVEPVFSAGSGGIRFGDNGEAVTVDAAPSVHFEVTVLLEEDGARILGTPDF